ncbi:MAG TPA: hypothetical protein VHK24_04145 [Steroidobacter sp.]|jgi:hypothetical protein|nr:hypothetical protein [Steroidobacter sp.]
MTIINLRKAKRRRAEQKTLCASGFHKWETLSERRFDVKRGKLVTAERCKRCGTERVKAV